LCLWCWGGKRRRGRGLGGGRCGAGGGLLGSVFGKGHGGMGLEAEGGLSLFVVLGGGLGGSEVWDHVILIDRIVWGGFCVEAEVVYRVRGRISI